MLLLQGSVRRLIRTCWPHFCNAYVHGDSKTSRGETASIDPRSGKLRKAQVPIPCTTIRWLCQVQLTDWPDGVVALPCAPHRCTRPFGDRILPYLQMLSLRHHRPCRTSSGTCSSIFCFMSCAVSCSCSTCTRLAWLHGRPQEPRLRILLAGRFFDLVTISVRFCPAG